MTLQDLFYQVKKQNAEAFSELLFNLYEDTSAYTVEAVFDDDALLIGRDDPAVICEKHGDFHTALREFEKALRTFYEQHKNALENLKVISYGFVDGDLEYIKGTDNSYSEEEQQPTGKNAVKEKLQRLIGQKISQWQEQDIYAISLYVYDEEDDPRRPVAVLGYNTERRVQESIPQASDEQEARWNYAFWLQNEELCLGRGDTAEDVRSWIKGLDLWDREEEITEAFVGMLVRIVKDIHASGMLQERFGKEIPILIHELEYHGQIKIQNIEANGADLIRDFVLFCIQDGTLDANDKMPALECKEPELKSSPLFRDYGVQAQKRSTVVPRRQTWEPATKTADMRTVMMFLVTLVFTVGLIACLYFLYLYNRDTAADKQGQGGTQQENEELPEPTTAVSDAASDSYQLRYDGMDTGIEILLKDCTCEYHKDSIQVYSCFVDDAAVEVKGYAIYIRTPEDMMQIFPVKDYRVDESAGRLYMLWGNKAFDRIQGIDFLNGIDGFKMESTYSMEGLIGEAYGLELSEGEEDFEDLQVDFTGLYQEDGKTLLRGKASALYRITGKRYSIDWEIDTESLRESAKAYLADLDIHPLYAAFLRGQISVVNPYAVEGATNTELSFSDDRDYEDEHFTFRKSFALVDVSGDGNPELVFQMTDSPSKLMYILGVWSNELICFDVFETHTSRIGFGVYDNGVVYDYDEERELYCTYTDDGKICELIHFVAEEDGRISYYLEGNEDAKISLQSDEEYEKFLSSYWEEEPGWPKWFDCDLFADIL